MPNQLPKVVEERILSFAIAHPGLGPKRVAAELRRPKWGGIVVSANGVWKALCRHGLNTRVKRYALVAGYAAPYERRETPAPSATSRSRARGQLVEIDCFYVGRLRGTEGADLAAHCDRRRLLVRLGRARGLQAGKPDRAADLAACPSRRPGASGCGLAAGAPAL